VIDSIFQTNSSFLISWTLSDVRLVHDPEVDWIILIPRREGIVELCELSQDDQVELLSEINRVSALLQRHGRCYKLNLGALGNITRQFHFHLIARMDTDRAWPGPIWGVPCDASFDNTRIDYWRNKFSNVE
jgi:diadenosine tetraphosphate (Ap4A) HIT family hydrolase